MAWIEQGPSRSHFEWSQMQAAGSAAKALRGVTPPTGTTHLSSHTTPRFLLSQWPLRPSVLKRHKQVE